MIFLRLTVFAFFVAAVVQVIRHFVPGDRRILTSVGWAVGTALVGALAILAGDTLPQEAGGRATLGFKLLGLLPLAGVLWVAIYAGQLLGDRQGGYWVKTGTRARNAILWGGAAVLGLLTLNWAICRFSALPLSPVPTGRIALATGLTHLGFSLTEEFFYRGCVQALLSAWLTRIRGGRWISVGLAALVFMAQHVAPWPHLVLVILPAGVVFGYLYLRFGLWTAVGVHFMANLVMAFVLPSLL